MTEQPPRDPQSGPPPWPAQPYQPPQYPQPGYPPQQGYPQQPGYPQLPGQSPYGQSPYGHDPYGELPQNRGNGLALAALIVGIVAVVFCWTVIGGILFGLAAVVLGFLGRSRIKKGATTSGSGMAILGIILGLLGAALSVVVIVVGIALFHKVGGSDYVDCMSKAGNDATAQQQCSDQFRNNIDQHFGVSTPVPAETG